MDVSSKKNTDFLKLVSSWIRENEINRNTIAELLEMKLDSFNNWLNRRTGAVMKRDLIITVCILLGREKEDIDEAIHKYNKFRWPEEKNKWYVPLSCATGEDRLHKQSRDSIIIQEMNAAYENYDALAPDIGIIRRIDAVLIANDLPPLEMKRQYNMEKDSPDRKQCQEIAGRFIILEKGYINEILDDPFGYEDSLESQYDLTRTDCSCAFVVKDKETDKTYELRCHVRYYGGESLVLESFDSGLPKVYKSLKETGVFKPVFQELRKFTRMHQKKLLLILDDTRNYSHGTRISANLYDNALHVFMESYDFQLPEENEYYLFEYYRGQYTLSVYHRSSFLYHFLQDEKYRKAMGNKRPKPSEVYHSPEEVEINDQDESGWYHSVAWFRKKCFESMKLKVDTLLEEIKTKKKTIRDYYGPFGGDPEGTAVICKYLGLEKEFDCHRDEQGVLYVSNKTEADIIAGNRESVHLSLNEVIRAFELGYHNRQEIIENKIKYGNVEEIF